MWMTTIIITDYRHLLVYTAMGIRRIFLVGQNAQKVGGGQVTISSFVKKLA